MSEQPASNDSVEDHREISAADFNPFSKEFVDDPFDVWLRLCTETPFAWHRDLKMWIASSADVCTRILKDNSFTPNYRFWEFAPPAKADADKLDFETMMDHALFMVDNAGHRRLRKLTMPAFSKKVMETIDEKIHALIVDCFDQLGTPEQFNLASEIAEKLPVRSIARMIGVPQKDEKIFQDFAENVVKAARINLTVQQREQAMNDAQEGIDYFQAELDRRRAQGEPGDDFIGQLIQARDGDDSLGDWDIIALVATLVAAGADTAVDVHTYLIRCLMENPDQMDRLKAQPELMENAIVDSLRVGGLGKFPFFRFAAEDIEFDGCSIKKGQAIVINLTAALVDPAVYDEPLKLDITRSADGGLVFGTGSHFCIGTYLVRIQARVMLEEFMRRFPNASLTGGDGEIAYDYSHHNARRISNISISTNLNTVKDQAA